MIVKSFRMRESLTTASGKRALEGRFKAGPMGIEVDLDGRTYLVPWVSTVGGVELEIEEPQQVKPAPATRNAKASGRKARNR